MRIVLANSLGFGLIDTVLFAPLFLLILFVGADAGGALLEQAALRNGLRDALNDQGIYSEASSYIEYDAGSYSVDEEATRSLLASLDNKITENIELYKSQRFVKSAGNYRIELRLIELEIDPLSGNLIEVVHEALHISKAGKPKFQLSDEITEFPQISAAEFLTQELQEEYQKTPSKYAVYLGGTYQAGASRASYMPKALLIYAEVTGLSSSMNTEVSNSLLGRLYGFQEQILIPVRTIIS